MKVLHMSRWASAASTLVVAVTVFVLFRSLAKRSLLHLAGHSAHSSRDVSASISHLSLRWNGLRPDSYALISIIIADPQLSFATLPAAANAPRPNADAPGFIRRVSAFHVRSLTRFGHAAGSCGMVRFFAAAISFARFVVAVLAQTLVLPLLAALIDLEVSRLSVSWAPSHDVDTLDAEPSPAQVCVRVRSIHIGWAARSGSVQGSDEAPRQRRASLGDEAEPPIPVELEESIKNATSVALRMKVAAHVSWDDVQVYAVPSSVPFPRQARPTAQSAKLWSFGTLPTWKETCSGWGDDGAFSSHPDSPEARSVLYVPGKGHLSLKTRLYTTIRFATVEDNREDPDAPILSFGFEVPKPGEHPSKTESDGWKDHFAFSFGPVRTALHTIGVELTVPPVVADTNALLLLLDHARRTTERRRRRSSAGVAMPTPENMAGFQDTSVPSSHAQRAPAWLHLVHQSCISLGGVRLLHTVTSPDHRKGGEQDGALIMLDAGPINATIEPSELLEKKQGILSWAWRLNQRISRKPRHPHVIDLIGTWGVEHIAARVFPAFSSTQENDSPEAAPVMELRTLRGRCQVAAPVYPFPPLLHVEVGIAKITASWNLPSREQGLWLTSLLTSLARQQRPPRSQRSMAKPDLNVVLDRVVAKLQFVLQFEVLVREVEGRLFSGDSSAIAVATEVRGGVFHLPPREDRTLSRLRSHAGISRITLDLANADTQEVALDVRESSLEAAFIIRSDADILTHVDAQGDIAGTIRAVRFRLDTPTSWLALEELAGGLGMLAEQVRSAQHSQPRPQLSTAPVQHQPAASSCGRAERSSSYRIFVNLNMLDFDARCAALDPKRRPASHCTHPAQAAQGHHRSRPIPRPEDGPHPAPTDSYRLRPLCPALEPTTNPVTGFRATFPRWRVEVAAVRTWPEEARTWAAAQSSRAALHLEPDALDDASARAQTEGKAVLTRSTLHGLQIFAVDPAPCGGEDSRPPVASTESDHHRHLIMRIPRSILEVRLSPGAHEGPALTAASFRFPGCNVLAIELANTYVMFMALAAFRRVWVSAKAQIKPLPTHSDSAASTQPGLQTDLDTHSRSVSFGIALGKLDVPIRLPNGLRLFLGMADFSAKQSLSFPLRSQMGALQLPNFLFRFRRLAGAVYLSKMGLWKPLDELEWVQLVGWDDGAIEVDWSTMGPMRNQAGRSSLDGGSHIVEPIKHWPSLLVTGKHARLIIPFQFVFHEVVVGTSVAVKATKQLVHESLLGQLDYKVAPSEMQPIPLPPIRLRLRTLVVEMEDSMIDTHLRVKQRIGKAEVLRRTERETAFQQQVQAILSSQHREVSSERRQPMPDLHHVQTLTSLRRAGSKATPRHISPFRRSKESSPFSSSSPSFSERGEDSEESDSVESIDTVTATIEAARRSLNEYDSQQWIALTRGAEDLIRQREANIRVKLRGTNHVCPRGDDCGNTSSVDPDRPWTHLRDLHEGTPLFRSTMTHVDLRLSQPHSYTATEVSARKFIDSFGDPVPVSLTFSVFIPLHLELEMDEWMCNLRDYPLPLLHVLPDFVNPFDPTCPAAGASTVPSAFHLATDLCIAEQMGDERSTCHLQACLVHDDCLGACGSDYVLQIPKVTMPTKMFGHPVVQIRSSLPLQLAWGQSMSPAIAEVTKVFDGFSSPPLDPSPKLGFWDKIPLILHGSFELLVAKPSAVQLFLKGSRDPYNLRGHGAGWVQVWSDGVRAVVAPPKKKEDQVIQIFSGSYELAIPDLNVFTGPAACSLVSLPVLPVVKPRRNSHGESLPEKAVHTVELPPLPLQKIVWSLKGNVVWGCGFVLERTCNGPDCVSTPRCTSTIPFYRHCRFFNNISHWKVLPRTPEYLDRLQPEERCDSYTGWRHHHVHLSMSVRSRAGPSDDEAAVNSLHVTPLVSSHFWAWIHLFNSALGLPIRAGPLFPSLPTPSPKFGQHCATIKYRIDLAPMSLAHVYLQHNAARHKRGANLFLGLKARVGAFNVDLHQRQQEMISTNKATGKTQTVLHKPLSATEVDFRDGELRGCVAKILDLGRAAHWAEMTGGSADLSDDSAADLFLQDGPDESHGDADGWWDYRDYVELGGRIGRDPGLRSTRARSEKILEWPAFNYFRRNPTRREIELQVKSLQEQALKEGNTAALEEAARQAHHLGAYGESKFGHEGTHSCLMGQDQTPDEIQEQLLSRRVDELRAGPKTPHAKRSIHIIRDFAAIVPSGMELFGMDTQGTQRRKQALANRQEDPESLARLKSKVHEDGIWSVPTYVPDETLAGRRELSEIHGHWANFSNRYVVHNPVLHIQESTRNILLRYYISNRLRRGQSHFLRYAALKSIQGLRMGQKTSANPSGQGVEMLRTLLDDTISLFADESQSTASIHHDASNPFNLAEADPYRGIRPELEVRKSTVCAVLRPQIILHSQVDGAASVVLTAVRMRLEMFGVHDPSALDNDLNSHVLNRSWFFSDQVKVWATKAAGHRALPVEALLDPFDQEGQKTIWRDYHQLTSQLSLQVQFDHFNPLRIANVDDPARDTVPFLIPKDQEHLLHRTDLVRVTAPPLNILADAEQFEAITYAVSLLLYSDPAYKQRQEQLQTLLLAYDFTDSHNLTRVISSLQSKIRDTMHMHEEYEASYAFLTQQGRFDAGECIAHLRDLIQEVTLFMDAVKAAQDQQSGDQDKKSGLRLEANAERIVWTMLRSQAKSRLAFRRTEQEPERLAELHVQGTSFTWLSKADSSIANALSIKDVEARDVRPDAIFPVILSKFRDSTDKTKSGRFLEAVWQVLAPVAGISIVDRFEVDVHPLNIQLEKAVGREIAEYAFASRRKKAGQHESKRSAKGAGLAVDTSATGPAGRDSESATSAELRSPSHHSGFFKFHGSRASHHSPQRTGSGTSDPGLPGRARSSVSDRTASTTSLAAERARQPGQSNKPSHDASLAAFNRMDDVDEDTMRMASEMRQRAARNRTFVYVRIPKAVICLSYRGDNKYMNLYDSVVQTPQLELCQTTGTLEDVMDEFKKAVVRAAWSQKTTLLRGVLRHRPRRITKRLAIRDKLRKQAASTSAKSQRRKSAEPKPSKEQRTGYISASSSDLDSDELEFGAHSSLADSSLSPAVSTDKSRVHNLFSRLHSPPMSSGSNPSGSGSGSAPSGPPGSGSRAGTAPES